MFEFSVVSDPLVFCVDAASLPFSSDQKEIDMVIEHAKEIKGVLDIINYIQSR